MEGPTLVPYNKVKFMNYASTFNKSFSGCLQPLAGVDGNTICANNKWIAIPWKAAGGALMVQSAYDFMDFNKNRSLPLILGHTGAVQDCSFAPFDDDLLGTASADGTVKVWRMPENGLEQDMKESEYTMMGHEKKVTLLKWNPVADQTLASTS